MAEAAVKELNAAQRSAANTSSAAAPKHADAQGATGAATHCAPLGLFVQPVDEEYLCAGCRLAVVDPCQLPCGHDCGRGCLVTTVEGAVQCPACLATHPLDSVQPLPKIARLTAKLAVTCSTHCGWSGTWGNLEGHLNLDCPSFEILCPFRCGERRARRAMPDHKKACPQRTEPCAHCMRQCKYVDIGLHEERCPLRVVPCPSDCGVSKRQEQIESHLTTECVKRVVPCPFAAYGCEEVVTRGSISQHVSSFLERHCQLLVGQMQKERVDAAAAVNALKDRIAVLEKEVKGQHAVDGVPLQTVVKSLQTTITAQQQIIDQFLTGSVVVVDAGGKCGMFSFIGDAVRECREGDTILLRQGVYKENIVLSKAGVVIRGSNPNAVVVSGHVVLNGTCTLSNVTVQQNDGNTAAVRITGGSPTVLECIITSPNLSCVIVEAGSPTLTGCTISGSLQYGICWRSATRGLIADCTVLRNAQGNVVVEHGDAYLRGCDLAESPANGLLVKTGASAEVDGCSMHDNKYSNMDVMPNARAVLRGCTLFRSDKCGLYCGGKATVEKSKIFDNKLPNVLVLGGAEVSVVASKLLSSLQQGLVVKRGGKASLVQCEVRGNCLDNIAAETGGVVDLL